MNRLRNLSILQWLAIIAVIVWTMFIWGNSLHTVDASKVQSQQVEEYVEPVLDAIEVPESSRQHFVRKSAHVTEFFVLGVLWTCVFAGRRLWWPLGLCLGTAAADETLQFFVPGRGNQLTDVGIDFAGAFAGVVIAGAAVMIIRKLRKKKLQR